MKTELTKLFNHISFDRAEAKDILMDILTNDANSPSLASFITVYNMRQPTIQEMLGFRDAMMDMCKPIDLEAEEAIDIVGTGGDGKNTFNISTLSALIVAAAGIKVVKHGNYSSSSISGSSNVLEQLTYRFSDSSARLQRQLDEANICFLHAPLFHPIMQKVKQVRKELNVQTFFNLLGPLINPASPGKLMLGVSHHSHIRRFQYILQEIGKDFSIIHSTDGYDEISLTGSFKVVQRNKTGLFYPADIGMQKVLPGDIIAGNSIGDATNIFHNILQRKGTHQQEMVVIANSAFAIQCAHPAVNIEMCIEMATTALRSGKAYQTLKKIIELS